MKPERLLLVHLAMDPLHTKFLFPEHLEKIDIFFLYISNHVNEFDSKNEPELNALPNLLLLSRIYLMMHVSMLSARPLSILAAFS